MEEYGTVGQHIDDNIIGRMRVAYWVRQATNTHSRICNSFCFPTVAMVTRMCLTVVLYKYVHCLVMSVAVKHFTRSY